MSLKYRHSVPPNSPGGRLATRAHGQVAATAGSIAPTWTRANVAGAAITGPARSTALALLLPDEDNVNGNPDRSAVA